MGDVDSTEIDDSTPIEEVMFSDYSKICRLCLKNDELKLLDDVLNGIPLFKSILLNFANVDLDSKQLPQNICTKCVSMLENFDKFIKKSEEMQEVLCYYDTKRKYDDFVHLHDHDYDVTIKDEDNVDDPVTSEEGLMEVENTEQHSGSDVEVVEEEVEEVESHCSGSETEETIRIIHEYSSEEDVKEDLVGVQLHNTDELHVKEETVKTVDEKRYKCGVKNCTKSFTKAASLKTHQITHSGLKPYKCTICHKSFQYQQGFERHFQSKHSANSKFQCNICEKFYVDKDYLEKHKLSHYNINEYECEVCHKQFAHHSSIVKHRLMHLDMRPFQCRVCQRGFRTKNALDEHMAVHTEVKEFTCEFCGRCFRLERRLKYHLTTHM